jgi:hypothetical protein
MEEILDYPSRKSDLTPIITASGRMRQINLVLPVVVGRMPHWFETLLAPHMKRFAEDSWCPGYWDALTRLSFLTDWRTRWGTNETDWFVSLGPIPPDEQRTLFEQSKTLKFDMGMSLNDCRFLFAPKGTWSRR